MPFDLKKLRKVRSPSSEAMLARYEENLATTLPDDYREFLLSCNGGFPSYTVLNGFRASVKEFYAIEERELFDPSRYPKFSLAIARDGSGNDYVMMLAGKVRGQIYYWDHECEPADDFVETDDNPFPNITPAARSFREFYDRLIPNWEMIKLNGDPLPLGEVPPAWFYDPNWQIPEWAQQPGITYPNMHK